MFVCFDDPTKVRARRARRNRYAAPADRCRGRAVDSANSQRRRIQFCAGPVCLPGGGSRRRLPFDGPLAARQRLEPRLVELARKSPGKLNYGAGIITTRLAGYLFASFTLIIFGLLMRRARERLGVRVGRVVRLPTPRAGRSVAGPVAHPRPRAATPAPRPVAPRRVVLRGGELVGIADDEPDRVHAPDREAAERASCRVPRRGTRRTGSRAASPWRV